MCGKCAGALPSASIATDQYFPPPKSDCRPSKHDRNVQRQCHGLSFSLRLDRLRYIRLPQLPGEPEAALRPGDADQRPQTLGVQRLRLGRCVWGGGGGGASARVPVPAGLMELDVLG